MRRKWRDDSVAATHSQATIASTHTLRSGTNPYADSDFAFAMGRDAAIATIAVGHGNANLEPGSAAEKARSHHR